MGWPGEGHLVRVPPMVRCHARPCLWAHAWAPFPSQIPVLFIRAFPASRLVTLALSQLANWCGRQISLLRAGGSGNPCQCNRPAVHYLPVMADLTV